MPYPGWNKDDEGNMVVYVIEDDIAIHDVQIDSMVANVHIDSIVAEFQKMDLNRVYAVSWYDEIFQLKRINNHVMCVRKMLDSDDRLSYTKSTPVITEKTEIFIRVDNMTIDKPYRVWFYDRQLTVRCDDGEHKIIIHRTVTV